MQPKPLPVQLALAACVVCLILPACAAPPQSVPAPTLTIEPPPTAPLAAATHAPAEVPGDRKTVSDERKAPRVGQRVTLEGAVTRALSWNPSIEEAIGKLGQSGAEIEVARAGYLPKVTGGTTANFDSNLRDNWRPQLNLRGSQMIYDFGKVSNAVDAATSGEAVSRAQLLQAVDNLVRDTAHAVIEVQRARGNLTVARAQLAGIEAIAALVRQRSDEGASTRSDKVQAEARVQAARSTVLEVSAQLSRWEGTLASLLGSAGHLDVSPEVPSWLPQACGQSEPAWSEAPAVMEADAQHRQAAALLARSKSDLFPTVALEAGVGYDFNKPSYDIASSTTPDRARFSVGLNVSGSLYDGGASGARQNAAGAALRAADAARDAARLQLRRGLVEAHAQVGGLEQLLKSLGFRAKMMVETRDLYRQQYFELGTRTLLDLLNAEQELHAAHFEKVRASHELRRLWIDCLYNSGLTRKSFSLAGTSVRGVTL